jgi:glycosyltransferase involved in cell wall biosynthesis
MKPRVSVVIPCFNVEKTIDRAVTSVAAQSATPDEVLCVNDGSTDSTGMRLQALQSRFECLNIQIITSPDQRGAASARNTGWNVAKGDYIAFLDADDTWHPNKLFLQIAFMSRVGDAAITGHRVESPRSKSSEFAPTQASFQALTYRQILLSNRLLTPSVVIRNTTSHRFDQSMVRCEDYLLWCQMIATGSRAFWSPMPLASVHKDFYGEGGLSGSILSMAKWEFIMYAKLYESNLIARGAFAGLSLWLSAKVIRRLSIQSLRRRS